LTKVNPNTYTDRSAAKNQAASQVDGNNTNPEVHETSENTSTSKAEDRINAQHLAAHQNDPSEVKYDDIADQIVANMQASNENEANLKEAQEKKASSYGSGKFKENPLFSGIANFLAPITKKLDKYMVLASFGGAALHSGDGLEQIHGKESKILGKSSVIYSKFIIPLNNFLKGFEPLRNNDIYEGLSRLSLGLKSVIKSPANLGFPTGAFLGWKVNKVMLGEVDKEIPKKFNSPMDCIKYYGKTFGKFYQKGFKELMDPKVDGATKLKNVAAMYFMPVLPLISTLGLKPILGEVTSPKAKKLGFIRNTAGISGDIAWLISVMQEVKKTHAQESRGWDFKKDVIDTQLYLACSYGLNSIVELGQRYLPEKEAVMLSQLNNSLYEINNAFAGMETKPKNNIVPIKTAKLTKNVTSEDPKPLEIKSEFNSEKEPVLVGSGNKVKEQ
jgi:hypothetical protein